MCILFALIYNVYNIFILYYGRCVVCGDVTYVCVCVEWKNMLRQKEMKNTHSAKPPTYTIHNVTTTHSINIRTHIADVVLSDLRAQSWKHENPDYKETCFSCA